MSRTLAGRIWITFAIALAIKCLVQPNSHSLFPCFSTASLHWWQGWSMFDRRVIPHDFRYSPAFAVLFTPFAYFPSPWGGLLWAELNLLALWTALQTLFRKILPLPDDDKLAGWFLTLSLLGTARSLWPAQCNLLILASAVGALACIQRNRWWLTALFLVAPVFIKVWPLAFLALCFLIHPLKLLFPILVWMAFFIGFPFLTQSFSYVRSQYHEWYLALVGPISIRVRSFDAWAVWESLSPPVSPMGYMLLQFTVAGLLALTVLRNRLLPLPLRQQQTFLLWGWTSWQVLFGPGVERMTLGLVSPLSAWVLLAAWPFPIPRLFSLLGFALTQVACNVNFERPGHSPHWMLLHPVGLTLLWFAYFLRIRTSPPSPQLDQLNPRAAI